MCYWTHEYSLPPYTGKARVSGIPGNLVGEAIAMIKVHPLIEFRVPKWPFNKDPFALEKYKWEDPHAQSSSPTVLKKTICMGGISLGLRYEHRER